MTVMHQLLANRHRVGSALWELIAIITADSSQLSVNKIAAALGKDRRTVGRNIRKLEQAKILERRAIPGAAHEYRVNLSTCDKNVAWDKNTTCAKV